MFRSLEIIKVFVVALVLVLCGAVAGALADYVTIDGRPVTQGQMLIASASLDQVKASTPTTAAPDQFILQKTEVEAEITGVVVRVRLRQVFQNPYDERLETIYVFPMPENAAVDGYSFRIGEKVIKGVVKEKEQARKEYEQAKQEGRKAGLLEQERPDIFTQSLVNIPPKATVVANIEYVHPLKIDGASYLFNFPMVVAPRYIPGQPVGRANVGRGWANDTDQVPDASRITPQYMPPGMRAGNDISISVKIDAGMPIQAVTGVTHELAVNNTSQTMATVTLKNGPVIPNKDFMLEYRVGGQSTMLAAMTHKEEQGDGFFSIVIQPKHSVERKEIAPRDLILVLDTSGSMQGAPVSQLRIFAEYVLGTLNPQDRFNVIAFSNDLNMFASQYTDATPANIANGQNFVRGLVSSGGTEMLPALREALKPASEKAQRNEYVILVTDALVGNDSSILNYLNQPKFAHLRVYPVAMGPAPNDYLIQRAAEIGRGFSLRIANEDNAAEMAKRFAAKISFPIMTDLALDWGQLKVKDLIPEPLPDLYADRPLVLIGRYEKAGGAKVKLSGNIMGSKVVTEFDLTLPETDKSHDSLPVLWARARIRQLENKEVGNISNATKDKITEIGLNYQLVTDYTSFIAVERDIPGDLSKTLKTQPVLLAIPEGMEHLFDGSAPTSGANVYAPSSGSATVVAQAGERQQPAAPTAQVNVPRATDAGSARRSGGGGGGGSVEGITIILSSLLLAIRSISIFRNRKK
ncbi:MAG: VIT domain-containing protein [Desulfobacteraceae bacterium]|nr:VIT domain-containing protein [Desulfobacteraceae bacterium]